MAVADENGLGDLTVIDSKFGASAPIDATQKEVIENIIREYLMEHPEVIRDAMEALEQKRIAEEGERQTKAIADNREKLLHSPLQVVLGNPAGDVTLVEFFDYNCGYCRRAHADMVRLINEDSQLRVVLKEFPVLGPASMEAAQVAVAVNIVAPERYGEFHEKVLGDGAQASADRATAIAESMGIDGAKLREAIKNDTVGKTIEEVYAMANALGLTGTPSYVVGDEIVVGAVGYDELKSKIDAVRACGATVC
jgi:protein-disulfide isomerase